MAASATLKRKTRDGLLTLQPMMKFGELVKPGSIADKRHSQMVKGKKVSHLEMFDIQFPSPYNREDISKKNIGEKMRLRSGTTQLVLNTHLEDGLEP